MSENGHTSMEGSPASSTSTTATAATAQQLLPRHLPCASWTNNTVVGLGYGPVMATVPMAVKLDPESIEVG